MAPSEAVIAIAHLSVPLRRERRRERRQPAENGPVKGLAHAAWGSGGGAAEDEFNRILAIFCGWSTQFDQLGCPAKDAGEKYTGEKIGQNGRYQ